MKSFEIENIRKFTGALFAGESFDSFCVTEASFSTLFNISIDGHINQAFLGDEPLPEGSDESVLWKKIRPLCYEIIKGQRVPLQFKIVFMMSRAWTAQFLSKEVQGFTADDVNGLFLNVKFESGRLSCTSGTSMKSFSLDKSVEEAWDKWMAGFLSSFDK